MYRIGIDLGGTNIAAGLVNEEFKIVEKISIPTGKDRDGELIVKDIASLCVKLCEKCDVKLKDIKAIGIACPGIADHDRGVIEYSCNFTYTHFPIAKLLEECLGDDSPKVHIENDANAAAWGEAVAGAAKGYLNSVMITLGTGVGGGVIIDGKIYSGFNYAGTELGHTIIQNKGRQCSCGRKGCWEAYSSATGLINMTADKLKECEEKGEATVMTELVAKKGKISGRTAFDGMRLGDKAATEVVMEYADYLACGLCNMVNIFQPEVLSIGGGLSNEGQTLLDLIVPQIRAEQYGTGTVPLTDIRIAQLGNDAGIIGAALLGDSIR